MKITAAQAKTLRTLIDNGGEMNGGYAGQRGFYVNSVPVLRRQGLVERIADCANCENATVKTWDGYADCQRPLAGQSGGNHCYGRVRVTDSGRAALASYDASKES